MFNLPKPHIEAARPDLEEWIQEEIARVLGIIEDQNAVEPLLQALEERDRSFPFLRVFSTTLCFIPFKVV